MKITCQSCQSKYTVSDEKVQGKTVKIKCRKCGATILVNSGGVTTTGGAVADPLSVSTGPAGSDGASYMVNVADGDQRTMSLGDIVAAYQSSVVNADTYVWADGMNDWTPLGQVEAIVSALNAPAAPAPASAPPPAAEPEPRVAARRDPGRKAQDLFSTKPGEDVATSAASYNGSPPAAAPPRAAATPGMREENSMLFSLSALTAKAGSSSSGPSSVTPKVGGRDREDSGIIDLKALAAAAQSPSAAPAVSMLPEIGLFPLGAPSLGAPIAAPPVVGPAQPQAKNKTPLFIGVGAIVAIGAIAGAFFLMKGGPPPPPPAPAVTDNATPSATATVAATATAAPTETAAASAAPTASATAQAVASKGRGVPGRLVPPTPRGGGGAPTPPPTPPPAKAGKGNCGCAQGDLMCAMKCSAH